MIKLKVTENCSIEFGSIAQAEHFYNKNEQWVSFYGKNGHRTDKTAMRNDLLEQINNAKSSVDKRLCLEIELPHS